MSVRWHKVELFNVHYNLSPLLSQLQSEGVLYRVTEESDGQWLWVDGGDTAESLKRWLADQGVDFRQPPQHEQPQALTNPGESSVNFVLRKYLELKNVSRHFPVTILTIILGVVGALLIKFDQHYQWVGWLTFQPVARLGDRLAFAEFSYGWEQLHYWRLFTPVFLHFGLFHILFNALWIWEFGRRIELRFGSGFLALSILLTGVGSNVAQYVSQGTSLFGGLSGVLYALLGFLWIYNRFRPHRLTTLPPGIIGFMLFWMVLGMSGAIDVFIDGRVANAAHFGGLLCGILLALIGSKVKLGQP
ncbi:MAG: rhomboid family intramembrane serine protease [Cellvibrionaceae bacterium]|nr:rhomboid family intramembrane serine protease [Cellvibrionaceae bacterium]|tara:strand:+ start:7299 stop:8207 length:909 start_codon:yes stop_codon:yes gene_type:complete